MNFYPQWSTKLLYIDKRGKLAFKETEPEGLGFKELISDHYERYQSADHDHRNQRRRQ